MKRDFLKNKEQKAPVLAKFNAANVGDVTRNHHVKPGSLVKYFDDRFGFWFDSVSVQPV